MRPHKTQPNVNKAPKGIVMICTDCGFSTKDNRKMNQHCTQTRHKVK